MDAKASQHYFVSYARGDKKTVNELLEGLRVHLALSRRRVYTSWKDDEDLMPENESYHAKILEALDGCDFALIFASPLYFTRDYIRKYEIPPFLAEKDRKRAVIIGLSPVNFIYHDLQGFEKFQFHRFDDKFYTQCDDAEKEQYVHTLFVSIESILDRAHR